MAASAEAIALQRWAHHALDIMNLGLPVAAAWAAGRHRLGAARPADRVLSTLGKHGYAFLFLERAFFFVQTINKRIEIDQKRTGYTAV